MSAVYEYAGREYSHPRDAARMVPPGGSCTVSTPDRWLLVRRGGREGNVSYGRRLAATSRQLSDPSTNRRKR